MSAPAHGRHAAAKPLRKRSSTRRTTPATDASAEPAPRVWQPPAFIVRMHPCPTCGALPGQPCTRDRYRRTGDNGRMTRLETERKRHHMARVELAWPDELREPRVERPLFPVPSRNHAGPNGPVAEAADGPR